MENLETTKQGANETRTENPVSNPVQDKPEQKRTEQKIIKSVSLEKKPKIINTLASDYKSIEIKQTQTIHQRWNSMRDKASGRNFNATTCKDIGLKNGTVLYSGKPEKSMVAPVAILEIPKIGTQVKIVLLDNVAKKHAMRHEILNLDNGSLVILGEKKMVGNNLSKENFKTHGWDWLRVKTPKQSKSKK